MTALQGKFHSVRCAIIVLVQDAGVKPFCSRRTSPNRNSICPEDTTLQVLNRLGIMPFRFHGGMGIQLGYTHGKYCEISVNNRFPLHDTFVVHYLAQEVLFARMVFSFA